MNILFLTDNFWPERNAPAIRTHEHAREWVRAGHSVTVITTAPNFPQGQIHDGFTNSWYSESDIDGIRIVRVKSYIAPNAGVIRRTLDYLSFMVSGLFAGLFQTKPDILISTSPQFFCAVAGWALSRVRRMPWVFELRDLWPESIVAVEAMKRGLLIRMLEALELRMYRDATFIISVTNSFKENLVSRGIASDRISVVRNGVDLQAFDLANAESSRIRADWQLQDKFVAGYIGTVGMAHSLSTVVQAAAILREHDEIVFVICGSGAELDKVMKEAQALELTNLRFIPNQSRSEMPSIWGSLDAAIVSLKDVAVFETVIPSKIFEAMAMGVPILMSVPKGEATDLVLEVGAGLEVAPENPEELADAVIRLKSKSPLQKELSDAGLSASQKFSRITLANEMLDQLKEIVAKDRRG